MRIFIAVFIFMAVGVAAFWFFTIVAPTKDTSTVTITVTASQKKDAVLTNLYKQNSIKSVFIESIILTLHGNMTKIQPGGYYVKKNMNAFEIANKLSGNPDMKWVTIPEGLRKEEIGERLQKALGWNDEELQKWDDTYTAMSFDNFEGVYFPDTYLIPVKESGLDVAKRMITHFNEVFAPYQEEFAKQNVIWTTGLKIASIVQREAAGKDDMPIIAGVIWNRLLKNQMLQIDATVQYARGKTPNGWWAPVTPDDIQNINSAYNTYKHTGLPPHPISNPGLDAIDAVAHPADTDCLYYLHDKNRQIHCSKTYEEHLANIKKYLQ